MTLTVGSLFSGIGGLDLGLERAGMEVIWQSEIDPYSCKVLSKHWPKVPNYGNIKDINWGDVVRPDVICGGYPCQPFSLVGPRKGADDQRHLWPWVREAISELRPKYALLENVRGHISLGLDAVLADLASIGYDAEWSVVRASAVGAPHRRERLFIVAYPNKGSLVHSNINGGSQATNRNSRQVFTFSGRSGNSTPRSRWLSEPDVGRVANGVPSRVDRLRGLGNAVVPQVAELIGRMVIDYDTNL